MTEDEIDALDYWDAAESIEAWEISVGFEDDDADVDD